MLSCRCKQGLILITTLPDTPPVVSFGGRTRCRGVAGSLAPGSAAHLLLINHNPSVLNTLLSLTTLPDYFQSILCGARRLSLCELFKVWILIQSHISISLPLPAAHCHSPLWYTNLQLGLLDNSATSLQLHSSLHRFNQPLNNQYKAVQLSLFNTLLVCWSCLLQHIPLRWLQSHLTLQRYFKPFCCLFFASWCPNTTNS